VLCAASLRRLSHPPADIGDKPITPMGGFPHYGVVNEDFLMVKGSVPGPRKRILTVRKSLMVHTSRRDLEKTSLKWINTASTFGHGIYQTGAERLQVEGPRKAKPVYTAA
jgi:large subunit ribosomal protein L3e